jgi:trehalose-6-phosphate synthase
MFEALMISDENRKINHQKLYRYVTKYTAAFWGLSFIEELRRVCEETTKRNLTKLSMKTVVEEFRKSTKRVILLDYDGTLTSAHKIPEFAVL